MTTGFKTDKSFWLLCAIVLFTACGSSAVQSNETASVVGEQPSSSEPVSETDDVPAEPSGISTTEDLSLCLDPDWEAPEMNLANVLDEVEYWIAVDGIGDFASEDLNEFLPVTIEGVALDGADNQSSSFQVALYGDQHLSIVKALGHPDAAQVYLPVKLPLPALGLGDDDGRAAGVIVELADGDTVLGGDCMDIELAKGLAETHGQGLPGFAAAASELTGKELTEFAFPGSTS